MDNSHRTIKVLGIFAHKWLVPNPGTIVTVLLLLFTVPSLAQPGTNGVNSISISTIPYQGRLASADGTPVTGMQNMAFSLYETPTGGTPLWQEYWIGGNSVAVSDGLFSIMLGSLNTDLTNIVQSHNNLYLGVTVGTDPEMSPRVQLGSVPFSIWALSVADGSITEAKIADLAVTAAKLAENAVINSKIAAGAVSGPKLAADAVTTDKIATGAVGNSDLATDAVTNEKIAPNAVGSSEIINGSIQTSDLANSSVTQAIAPSLVSGPTSNTKLAHGQATATRQSIDNWGTVAIPLTSYGFTQTPTVLCSVAGNAGARWSCHVEYETNNGFSIWVMRIDGSTNWSTVPVRWVAVGQ